MLIQNPLRYDPTRCATLRRKLKTDLTRALTILRKSLLALIDEDSFGLVSLTTNRFRFYSLLGKVQQFERWLRQEILSTLQSPKIRQQIESIVEQAMRRGVKNALAGRSATSGLVGVSLETLILSLQNFQQQRDLIVGRTIREIESSSNSIVSKLTASLTDALLQSSSTRILSGIEQSLKILLRSLLSTAVTTITRAHAEGQLLAFELIGVKQVGAEVEFTTTGDSKVCSQCASLEGVVFKVSEAYGIIPVHPYCYCRWSALDE